MTINLPPYPANDGPNIAKRLRNTQARFGQAATALETSLASVEEALTAALAEQDRRTSDRERLRKLALDHRKQTRRS